MAVCVVCSFIYIFECSRCLSLVLVYCCVILVCDAVRICGNHIVITRSTFYFIRKDYSCFITNNFNIADHWRTNFSATDFNIYRSCIVLSTVNYGYSSCSITVIFYIEVFFFFNNIAVHNCKFQVFVYRYGAIFKVFLFDDECKFLSISLSSNEAAFILTNTFYGNFDWCCSSINVLCIKY